MKKKSISLLLIVSILAVVLLTLTGCGDSKSKSSDEPTTKDLAKEVVEDFWKAYEDEDAEKLASYINWAGYYTMYNGYYYSDYSEFNDDYKEYKDSSEWEDKQEDIEDNEKDFLESVEDYVLDDQTYTFKKVKKASKLAKGLYKVTVSVEYESYYSSSSDEQEINFYVLEDGDDVKVIYDDSFIIGSMSYYLY